MKNIKKVLVVCTILVLLLGAAVIVKKGFNYGIDYKEVTELKFMLGQVLDMNEVQTIVNEAFNNKELKIKKINYFNDSINISVVEPTDEEIQTLIDKFNERYEQNNDMESVSMVKTGNISFYEIAKPYIFPSLIVLVLVTAYIAFRYREEGLIKTILIPIGVTLFVEVFFFVLYAILQVPVTIWTMPTALLLLLISLTTIVSKYEKNK